MAAAEAPKIRGDEKVALVLGAGGARGLAQIGVIEALQARAMNVVAIAGASSGALVGGLLQMLLGALLMAHISPATNRRSAAVVRFLLFNAGTIALLVGFALRDHRIIGAAGIVVAATVLL